MNKLAKVANLIIFVMSYIGILVLTLMLVSVIPGILNGNVFVDNATLLRFSIIYLLLFIISTTIAYGHLKLFKTNTLININKIVIFIMYIFFVMFIYIRRFSFNNSIINLIPFRSIISSSYDFISLTNQVSIFDYMKTIVFNIIYLIPIFILFYKKSNDKKALEISFLLIVGIEIIKYFVYKSFNIDNIILAIIGIICSYIYVIILRDINYSKKVI